MKMGDNFMRAVWELLKRAVELHAAEQQRVEREDSLAVPIEIAELQLLCYVVGFILAVHLVMWLFYWNMARDDENEHVD